MAKFRINIVHIPQSQSVFSPHVFCVISVRSGSHVSSSVSVKSDRSKDAGPGFSEKTPSSAKRYFIDFCFRKYIRVNVYHIVKYLPKYSHCIFCLT